MARFNLGSAPVVRVAWRDPDTGLPVDTTTTFTFTQPDGTPVTPGVSHDGPGEYSAVGPASQVGVVRVKAVASGSLIDDRDSVYIVVADYADLPWAPELAEVAAKVPLRTVEVGDPTGILQDTFTPLTLPSDLAAELLTQGAVEFVRSRLGDVPQASWGAATEAAALRAAAYVEQAQPPDERDAALIQQLLDQSESAITTAGAPGAGDAQLGAFTFPDLPPWAGGPTPYTVNGTWL